MILLLLSVHLYSALSLQIGEVDVSNCRFWNRPSQSKSCETDIVSNMLCPK